jgi:Ca-activated chloride channel family protein
MRAAFGRYLIAIVVSGTATAPSMAAQEPGDQPRQTFRSAVDLVTIQASVRDKRGRPLKDLTTADFEVRDNGQLRPVLSLRADRRSPVSVAILVDMSGSMRLSAKTAMARQAFESLVTQMRSGVDEVALFTFDSELHERQPFTSDLTRFRTGLDDFDAFGTTSLYDATASAARSLADRSATHKAIIVLTDGVDTSSRLTAPEVSALASSIDVPVYIVATIPSAEQRAMMERSDRASRSETADLRDLAEWTGGQFVFASSLVETVVAASTLVDELRQQYVLAIEAVNTHEWRRLDVRVKHPAATVKARSGYFGG